MTDEKIFIFDEFHWLKEDFERSRASVKKRRPMVRCMHGKRVLGCTRECQRAFTETADAHATELWRREKEKLFIEKAKSVHPGAYGYSNVHYVYALENVNITCLTCEKDFPQTPNNHLNGQGCRTCGERAQRKTLDTFIYQANEVHEHTYTYGNFVYVNYRTLGLITCPKHGDFPQAPGAHLQGAGCPTCGYVVSGDKQRKTLAEFVREANEMHEQKYTYGNFVYISSDTLGLITCPKHGDFPQTPNSHLNGGHGCPMCKNQTEGIVFAKLKEKLEIPGFKVEHMGNRVSEGVGRMDIRITKGCLIIYVEIDGPHHFRDMPHHKSRVKDVQTKDLEKHLKARAKGHRVIRIDQDWIWRAYTKKSKSCTWFARLQGTIQKISNGDDPGIDEMFLSDDHEKYLEHPCHQKEAVKEIISTSDITQ